MIEKYKNWIFDWSGTLVDDLDKVVDATNNVMSKYDKPHFTRATFKESFRLPYAEWYQELIPGIDIIEVNEYFQAGMKNSDAIIPVLPYARELLQLLQSKERRIFACTSVDTNGFTQQSEENGMHVFFEKPYSGVMDKRDLIEEILATNGLVKEETIFVGDMIHDVETAHHGGISSLAVLTGYNTREELSSVNPTYLLENYASLL